MFFICIQNKYGWTSHRKAARARDIEGNMSNSTKDKHLEDITSKELFLFSLVFFVQKQANAYNAASLGDTAYDVENDLFNEGQCILN